MPSSFFLIPFCSLAERREREREKEMEREKGREREREKEKPLGKIPNLSLCIVRSLSLDLT
jgi:hypothetical protein